jgi:DNA ligase D-like protein (predicted 3'-phosphoesterase)
VAEENHRLHQYRSMRDPAKTPEPMGDEPAAAPGNRFVVQEHHATALHWDFRLERDGVLVSWAVPKGIPPDPRENRMAVHTEDHPLDYIDFEGDIPEGEYGGGKVILWDEGTYEAEKFNEREVIVTLHGRRTHGKYALVQTRGKNWLMHRMDPPEDPTREPFPRGLTPMRPVESSMPDGADAAAFAFHPVWGGVHVLLSCEGGRVDLIDEVGKDVTDRLAEAGMLGRSLGALTVVLDGEVVPTGAKQAAFFANDLVWLDGHAAAPLPFDDRRRLLDQLDFAGPSWRVGPLHDDGAALLRAVAEQRLAGVIGRRRVSPYEPGQATTNAILIRAPSGSGRQ